MADLTDADKAAVAGLLTRFVENWTRREHDQKLMRDLEARISAHNDRIQKISAALSIFSFDSSNTNVWREVKETIGARRYGDAIAAGEKAAMEPAPLAGLASTPDVNPDDAEDLTELEDMTLDEELDDGNEETPQHPMPSGKTPTVRDALLSRLAGLHPMGTKAASLRTFLEQTYAMKLHEKTVGMTLYRLSQEDPPKVRRQGHTWFFSPVPSETKNPGVGAPGSSNSLL